MSIYGPRERRRLERRLAEPPWPSELTPAARRQAAIARAEAFYAVRLVCLGECTRTVEATSAAPRREIVVELFASTKLNGQTWARYASDPDHLHAQFGTEPPEPPEDAGTFPRRLWEPVYAALPEPAPEPLVSPPDW